MYEIHNLEDLNEFLDSHPRVSIPEAMTLYQEVPKKCCQAFGADVISFSAFCQRRFRREFNESLQPPKS